MADGTEPTPGLLTRSRYADLYGPTEGDRIRLADTGLVPRIDADWCGGPGRSGDETLFGGGKVIRESMGQSHIPRSHARAPVDTVITGALILDQRTAYGGPAPAWDGPAVLGGHRVTGQLLIVHPGAATDGEPHLIGDDPMEGCAVIAPLADGPALLTTAVAPSPARPRHLLDRALAHVRGA